MVGRGQGEEDDTRHRVIWVVIVAPKAEHVREKGVISDKGGAIR
jgi:hypothetical protein